jgi:hypothetical protein
VIANELTSSITSLVAELLNVAPDAVFRRRHTSDITREFPSVQNVGLGAVLRSLSGW